MGGQIVTASRIPLRPLRAERCEMQTQRQDEHNLSWELLKASILKAGSQSSFWLGSCQEDPAGRSNWQLKLGDSPVSSKCSQELRSYLHARGLFTWAGGGQYLPRTKAGKRGFRLSQTRGCPRARIWCRAAPPGQDLVPGGTLRARIWCRAEPSGLL